MSSPAQQSTLTVTASASTEKVRFTASSQVIEMRLAIYAEAGKQLFASTQAGNVLDWPIQDQNGQRLSDGSYLCVVSVKTLGRKESQKLATLTVEGKQVSLQPTDDSKVSPAQAQAASPLEESGAALTILSLPEAPAVTSIAHNGTEGELVRGSGALSFRVGDFYGGKDREQMRLTEEGNLGIGT
ncbi:MAG TPA: hypothetical protein VGC64_06870, partial [Pyrinomonadaceae bacterium]